VRPIFSSAKFPYLACSANTVTMIDPVISLAMAMRVNRGAYALLLGSGISRSAGIPTGFEVIVDLTRQVARASGEQCEPDPTAWYRNKFHREPNYSELLNALGGTPTERASILKRYFEPTQEEREQELKQPTEAHRAVANLVAKGYVKVILTTNFDRLTEQSLTEAGLQFQVISTPDAVDGSLPLAHSTCTVIKLHGDYQDIRTKNTPDELDHYDERINTVIDRVLDEYGLVIAGWSGEWDSALVGAIRRCKTRRFTTAWLTISEPHSAAKELISLRRASVIQASSADVFFTELKEKLDALEGHDESSSMSSAIAVSALKRYLKDPRYVIKLHDLIQTETKRAVATISSYQLPMTGSFAADEVAQRIEKYNSAISVLVSMIVHGAYWSNEDFGIWTQVIQRLSEFPAMGGTSRFLELRRYPGFLLYNAAGVAAVANNNWKFLTELMRHTRVRVNGKSELAASAFANHQVFVDRADFSLPIKTASKIAWSQLLRERLEEPVLELVASRVEFDSAIDRFEYLNGLIVSDIQGYGPIGGFVLKGWFGRPLPIIEEFNTELDTYGDRWPPILTGLFKSASSLKELKTKYDTELARCATQLRF
jgi:hypothetical protein